LERFIDPRGQPSKNAIFPMMSAHASEPSQRLSASDRERAVNRVSRIRNLVRTAITCFVLVLLGVVTLGWIWTNAHQPAPLRTASHVVLSVAALAGVFAVAKIWRRA
jgi:membrane protein YdbS with pleckstrin-like domain